MSDAPKLPIILEHGKLTRWHWTVWHPENLILPNSVDIGAFTYINALYGIEIGEDVQIGSHCSIYSVSSIDDKHGKVTIGRNARVGSHSTIMPGVTIGEGATVGAHSFVNRDVSPGTTVFGVPARTLRDKIHDNCRL